MSALAKKNAGELAVLVACHSFLVAIPTRSVVRLYLPDEVTNFRRTEGRAPFLGTLEAGGRTCAAWDLGGMLELPDLHAAWVVLEVEHEGRAVSLALRSGACVLVTELRPEASLPGRIFRRRARAFPAAFAANHLELEVPALFGMWLDPARLFSREELTVSRDFVDRAEREHEKS